MKFIERLERTRQSVRNALKNDWDKKKSRLGGPIRVKDNEFSSYIPFAGKIKHPSGSNDCRLSLRSCEEQYEQSSHQKYSSPFPPSFPEQKSTYYQQNYYQQQQQQQNYHHNHLGPIHRGRTRIKTNPWFHASQVNSYSKPFEHDYATPKENDYEEIGSRRNLTFILAKKRRHDFEDSYPHSRLTFGRNDDVENVHPSSKEFLMQRHKLCSDIQNVYGQTKQRSPRKTFKLQPIPPKRTQSSLSSPLSSLTSNSPMTSTSPTPSNTSKKLSRLQAKLSNIHDAVEQTKQRLF